MKKQSVLALSLLLASSPLLAKEKPLVITCSKTCSGDLSRSYGTKAKETIRCLDDEYARLMGGPTRTEFKNFFEITGALFKQGIKAEGKPKDAASEKEQLKTALHAGMGKYMWAIGTWDCQTHAKKLQEHLIKTLGNEDYAYEIVTTFQDLDQRKFMDLKGSLSPMGNHYLVRVVSKHTGFSYIVDGYTYPTVDREVDLHKKSIVLNKYEECFFPYVMKGKLGVRPEEDILGMIATFTPVLKSSVARGAKEAAAACLNGAEKITINPDIL